MRVVVGLMFFPRGGSAHVARALATQLAERDWEVTIVSGSGADFARRYATAISLMILAASRNLATS